MNGKLISVEQKTITFYDDDLIAMRADDGHVYVAIGQMCDALGIDRASQVRRIRSDEILTVGYQGSVKLTYPDGGTQSSGVLRVDLIPLWLTGLRIKAVREEVRPKLRRFKQEAAAVLWEAFQEGRLTADPSFDEILKSASTDTLEAYQLAMALVKLARNQIMIEAQVDSNKVQLTDHEQRLEEIESTLGDPGRHVTPDQASQISQAVKTVAIALGKQTKKNEFGAVYGELYRKYGVTSYKQIPASRFQTCMDWLSQWHDDLTGDAPF